jgi:hypothetical protein
MSIMGLLLFMTVSQVATAAYLLYMFNDVEREARKRNADLRAYLESRLGLAEPRVTGKAEPLAQRPSVSAAG